MARESRKVGYAVVGLGHIAQVAVLPAFEHAKNARLVALVSSDAEKRSELSERYGVKNTFDYEQFDECLAMEEVDAVYLAVPNHLHCDFTVRAAKAGVHVLCEKPLATSEKECEQMISACDEAGVRLMTAYRLHFEPANLRALKIVKSGELGEARYFDSIFSYQVSPGNIRTQREKGGGVLWDIGIYCLNAARTLFREEPTDVMAFSANSGDSRFQEIDESVSVMMRFGSDRLATFTCSFGSAAAGSYSYVGTKGSLNLENAYEYIGPRFLTWTVGEEKEQKKRFAQVDQFAPELIYFSRCILTRKEPEPSGKEGLKDVRIIAALHRSIESGNPVTLPPFEPHRGPSPAQEMHRPPVEEKPELVNVDSPHP